MYKYTCVDVFNLWTTELAWWGQAGWHILYRLISSGYHDLHWWRAKVTYMDFWHFEKNVFEFGPVLSDWFCIIFVNNKETDLITKKWVLNLKLHFVKLISFFILRPYGHTICHFMKHFSYTSLHGASIPVFVAIIGRACAWRHYGK